MKNRLFALMIAFAGCFAQHGLALANENLAAAIQTLGTSKSIEARDNLYRELNRATYLIPLAKSSSSKKEQFAPVTSRSPGGEVFQVIFSSRQDLSDAGMADSFVIEMHAKELWKLVDANPNIDGVVLNPARNAIPIKKERIRVIETYNH